MIINSQDLRDGMETSATLDLQTIMCTFAQPPCGLKDPFPANSSNATDEFKAHEGTRLLGAPLLPSASSISAAAGGMGSALNSRPPSMHPSAASSPPHTYLLRSAASTATQLATHTTPPTTLISSLKSMISCMGGEVVPCVLSALDRPAAPRRSHPSSRAPSPTPNTRTQAAGVQQQPAAGSVGGSPLLPAALSAALSVRLQAMADAGEARAVPSAPSSPAHDSTSFRGCGAHDNQHGTSHHKEDHTYDPDDTPPDDGMSTPDQPMLLLLQPPGIKRSAAYHHLPHALPSTPTPTPDDVGLHSGMGTLATAVLASPTPCGSPDITMPHGHGRGRQAAHKPHAWVALMQPITGPLPALLEQQGSSDGLDTAAQPPITDPSASATLDNGGDGLSDAGEADFAVSGIAITPPVHATAFAYAATAAAVVAELVAMSPPRTAGLATAAVSMSSVGQQLAGSECTKSRGAGGLPSRVRSMLSGSGSRPISIPSATPSHATTPVHSNAEDKVGRACAWQAMHETPQMTPAQKPPAFPATATAATPTVATAGSSTKANRFQVHVATAGSLTPGKPPGLAPGRRACVTAHGTPVACDLAVIKRASGVVFATAACAASTAGGIGRALAAQHTVTLGFHLPARTVPLSAAKSVPVTAAIRIAATAPFGQGRDGTDTDPAPIIVPALASALMSHSSMLMPSVTVASATLPVAMPAVLAAVYDTPGLGGGSSMLSGSSSNEVVTVGGFPAIPPAPVQHSHSSSLGALTHGSPLPCAVTHGAVSEAGAMAVEADAHADAYADIILCPLPASSGTPTADASAMQGADSAAAVACERGRSSKVMPTESSSVPQQEPPLTAIGPPTAPAMSAFALLQLSPSAQASAVRAALPHSSCRSPPDVPSAAPLAPRPSLLSSLLSPLVEELRAAAQADKLQAAATATASATASAASSRVVSQANSMHTPAAAGSAATAAGVAVHSPAGQGYRLLGVDAMRSPAASPAHSSPLPTPGRMHVYSRQASVAASPQDHRGHAGGPAFADDAASYSKHINPSYSDTAAAERIAAGAAAAFEQHGDMGMHCSYSIGRDVWKLAADPAQADQQHASYLAGMPWLMPMQQPYSSSMGQHEHMDASHSTDVSYANLLYDLRRVNHSVHGMGDGSGLARSCGDAWDVQRNLIFSMGGCMDGSSSGSSSPVNTPTRHKHSASEGHARESLHNLLQDMTQHAAALSPSSLSQQPHGMPFGSDVAQAPSQISQLTSSQADSACTVLSKQGVAGLCSTNVDGGACSGGVLGGSLVSHGSGRVSEGGHAVPGWIAVQLQGLPLQAQVALLANKLCAEVEARRSMEQQLSDLDAYCSEHALSLEGELLAVSAALSDAHASVQRLSTARDALLHQNAELQESLQEADAHAFQLQLQLRELQHTSNHPGNNDANLGGSSHDHADSSTNTSASPHLQRRSACGSDVGTPRSHGCSSAGDGSSRAPSTLHSAAPSAVKASPRTHSAHTSPGFTRSKRNSPGSAHPVYPSQLMVGLSQRTTDATTSNSRDVQHSLAAAAMTGHPISTAPLYRSCMTSSPLHGGLEVVGSCSSSLADVGATLAASMARSGTPPLARRLSMSGGTAAGTPGAAGGGSLHGLNGHSGYVQMASPAYSSSGRGRSGAGMAGMSAGVCAGGYGACGGGSSMSRSGTPPLPPGATACCPVPAVRRAPGAFNSNPPHLPSRGPSCPACPAGSPAYHAASSPHAAAEMQRLIDLLVCRSMELAALKEALELRGHELAEARRANAALLASVARLSAVVTGAASPGSVTRTAAYGGGEGRGGAGGSMAALAGMSLAGAGGGVVTGGGGGGSGMSGGGGGMVGGGGPRAGGGGGGAGRRTGGGGWLRGSFIFPGLT